ncbi:class I SAM-dependent methyltransferase [Ekhidna sp.]|uniref:class I SAM-dependent methyltransferase n=1 Tax=Ekhidna sp. TaxID=2608089 RepID=UPI0032ED2226
MNQFEEKIKFLETQTHLIDKKIREWWSNYLKNNIGRYEFSLGFINADKRDSVLEIGSIPCHLTYLLSSECNVTGVDLEPNRNKEFINSNGLHIEKCDIETEKLPFDDQSFDKIVFLEVLEHLRINPIFTLKEISRVLKPSGRLILSTPNVSVLTRYEYLKGLGYQGDPVEEFSKLETIGHMGHFRVFDFGDIKSMLNHVNLNICKTDYYGAIPQGFVSSILKPFYGKKLKQIIFIDAEKNDS